ncbi:hypothetical protein Tco_0551370 [Tanacetum coccineum]
MLMIQWDETVGIVAAKSCLMHEMWSKRGRGRESCKGEQHGSANVNVVSSAINEPSNTALINSGNKNGMEKGNIRAWSTPIGNTASNTGFESFPTISKVHGIPSPTNDENLNDVGTTVRPTSVGNTPGMSSYANVISEPSRKALSFRTLFTLEGNGIDVVVLVESIRANSERSSYARAMIELQADMELKDIIVVAMTKLTREGFYSCLGVAKNLKKPSQAPRGVMVGSKVGFKPVKQAYRPVSTKPTANTSGSKKNDNVESSSASTTPIVDKIGKFEKLIIDRKVTLVNDEGELVKKVDYPVDHDSEDEVASVDNDMARSMASKKAGFRTNSLLEQ